MKLKGLLLLLPLVGIAAYLWLRPASPLVLPMAKVQRGEVESLVANTRAGTVKACHRAYLSLSIGGPIDRLLVTEGDRVKAGQLMLALWQDDFKAALAKARAGVEVAQQARHQACLQADFAEREFKRVKALVARALISRQSLDDAKTKLDEGKANCEGAEAGLEEAKAGQQLAEAQLAKSELRAPFAGVVAEVNGEEGEYLIPSPPGVPTLPAIDLIDDSCLLISAPIDEVDAAKVALAQAVHVTLDAFPGQRFEGLVSRIAPYVLDREKQSRTVEVEVKLKDKPSDGKTLLVGYSADVEIITDKVKDSLYVPAEALLPDGSIYRLDPNGLLSKVSVTTGLGNWQQVAIRAGLADGDLIVLTPTDPQVAPGKAAVPKHD
ncbi:efflux RND transporter periplasmic adaptor subunit [Gallaecimonas kandeliae]|uniref:efflux RND transporter periplasmic adaptor subunit n=1 Tax=Gallaecimonas kandeliae TaxID=3029055 RepID=UPI00264A13FC|nr:efflux RND transporter periplasmic adaptor subunit [Gallaecimonas kandeliae]WKE66854.1 efflux RND transporter periplasmic adaptor subunit [Gallaecimonas kandeliae]